MPGPFLTARWESLVFLNYACPRAWPDPLVPRGTELDTWQGQTLVSLVGFLFAGTRLKGLPVPGHRTFEEVKLRFYVRRTTPAGELAATATGPARPSSSRSTTGAIPGSVTRAPWRYRVELPPWALWPAADPVYDGRGQGLHGGGLGELLSGPPRSAFVAVGSDVAVQVGARIA
jgi:hypothetical protein